MKVALLIRSAFFPLCVFLLCLCLQGCDGNQSMFRPGGFEAERVVFLFQVMTTGFTVIFLMVMLFIALAWRGPDKWRQYLRREKTVFSLGLIFPVVVLSALLGWGFWLLGISTASGPEAEVTIKVEGEQWWWRVTYIAADGSLLADGSVPADGSVLADGTEVESANEIRVPTGALIELELTSADVLHSFWIPAWAGKMDMIPGRTNILHFTVDSPGISRGQCAEYCGGAHALMALNGVAMEPDEFERWLAQEAAPVNATASEAQPAGREIFVESGCGACHRVRGEAAPGGTGPDLTHLASRLSIGAGILDNDVASLETWLARHPVLKPDNLMPAFGFLTADERQALAQYLKALE